VHGLVHCGTSQISLLTMIRVAVWLQHKQHQLPFDLDKEGGMLNASYMSAYVDHEQGWFAKGHGKTPYLADLFRYFGTFDCSEPRDKVYALLGLSRWSAAGNYPLDVFPDYTKSVRDVLRDATRAAICEVGDLWVFRFIEHGSHVPDGRNGALPSWIPSLYWRPDPAKEPNLLRSAFRGNRGLSPTEGLGTVRNEEYIGSEDVNAADCMILGGMVVDVVKHTLPVITSAEIETPESLAEVIARTLLDENLSLSSSSQPPASTKSIHDIMMVLCGGSTFDPSPVQVDGAQRSIFDDFVAALDTIKANASQQSSSIIVHQIEAVLDDKVFARCAWAIRYACTNRSLFVSDGGVLGLGPQAVREGDELCILADSRMPMMLRKAEKYYNVIGPCYAHGIMQGEAVSRAGDGQAHMQMMILV
jgi:hypothetical protein